MSKVPFVGNNEILFERPRKRDGEAVINMPAPLAVRRNREADCQSSGHRLAPKRRNCLRPWLPLWDNPEVSEFSEFSGFVSWVRQGCWSDADRSFAVYGVHVASDLTPCEL
ncbi:hypothetical protein N7495_001757 [Penicillium taxi]|uniref:uncharacterized protein n=1 Tax=Penicillium taxi TaxID=168475 RepID=UPI0025458922|nr:uncharacterized protein N7495_001757 [Penicillium taxi]KAJ5909075.1 hypothetical protein N7495_001757 [Penicillium taxi]